MLTFSQEYRRAVAPYFKFDNIEYGIDNENTINEAIRIIFKNEYFGIYLRKEALTFVYDGDPEDLKHQNGIIRFYWELYEKIKAFEGYTRTNRHQLTTHLVDIKEKNAIDEVLRDPSAYLPMKPPVGKIQEFACVYEFTDDDERSYRFQMGNYSEKDIKKSELSPYNSKYNEDLKSAVGLMAHLEVIEKETSPTYSKFKSLMSKSENIYKAFKLNP
jgi:hypothetical protein